MKNKSASQLVLVCLCTVVGFSVYSSPAWADASTSSHPPVVEAVPRVFNRTLTFEQRVVYQRAIEEVYWRHRIWPKECPDPKPSLDAVMSAQQLEKKVADYLRNSQALDHYWQRAITAEQLQAEMERMTNQTKQPEILRELFAALGNDPFVIAECLARPALAERLLANWYAFDQRFHGELKRRAEADLQAHDSVEKMKQTSGTYSEIGLVRSDQERDANNHSTAHGTTLNSREWNAAVQKLTALFNIPGAAKNTAFQAYERIPTGILSGLHEDATRYYARAVVGKTKDRLVLARAQWLKEPLESWLARVETQVPAAMAAPNSDYRFPKISNGTGSSIDDTWAAIAGPPETRYDHTAVWTGSEMIVWGGTPDDVRVLNTGGRYNPSTDTWTATNTANAPSARATHAAVWTGSEMIVWGGELSVDPMNTQYTNTGGRYNPTADTWIATSTANAPSGRTRHTAVWTGSEMIIWGGYDGNASQSGGRYNPSTNSWTPTSNSNAPSARSTHTAVWTGGEMIVWGGAASNTGGRYNPGTDSWTATSINNAPSPRSLHTAVWTGSEMIVWGGYIFCSPNYCYLSTGGRYNPGTDSWTATSIANAPNGRSFHATVWTGSEMIIWGYDPANNYEYNGSRYNPTANSWITISTTNAPSVGRPAVWTGGEMIVWAGGSYNGGRYNPATDIWTPTGTNNAPEARASHTAVWTGNDMIIWGGSESYEILNSGAKYNPAIDSWSATSITVNTPSARIGHAAVWTGSEMIVWGGYSSSPPGDAASGGRYNPMTDTWIATSMLNAPLARSDHTAVWTGSEMIVWGGIGCGGNCRQNTGSRYDPSTDSWAPTSTINAPSARYIHTVVWTGSQMIVWGGTDGMIGPMQTGGRYNPITNSWTATTTNNAPDSRYDHTAVWTGTEMIVWGGYGSNYSNSGGRYNPSTDSWTATNAGSGPSGRESHSAVWTGSEMIVWGGDGPISDFNNGGRYNPDIDSWTLTTTVNAPFARDSHTAVWTGSQMIVWGGAIFYGSGPLGTGGTYSAQPSTPIVQSAVSRKTHGSAGSFDVPLPLNGTAGIECRRGGANGDYTIVVTFLANVSVNGNPQAAVSSGIGTIGSGGVSNGGTVTVAGNIVTIPLTNVSNSQTIQVTLNSVNGSTNVTIPMRVLIGDVTGNGAVNASDVALTKSRLGQTLSATNFRSDVNPNGSINSTDVSLVKSSIGTGVP